MGHFDMIYSVLPNSYDFLSLLYDDNDVIEKLGEDHLVQADPSPVRYGEIWKTIKVGFVDAHGKSVHKPVPDIEHHCGHLFLSEKAASALKPLIADLGEFLDIEYNDGKRGFIFNPLKIVEADKKLSMRNSAGDVSSIAFNEEHPIFRSEFDDYYGVYCNQTFRDSVESNGLTGVNFELDLSNIFERSKDTNKPSMH